MKDRLPFAVLLIVILAAGWWAAAGAGVAAWDQAGAAAAALLVAMHWWRSLSRKPSGQDAAALAYVLERLEAEDAAEAAS